MPLDRAFCLESHKIHTTTIWLLIKYWVYIKMDALEQLLSSLEKIGDNHTELYDTDVKEQMCEAFIEIYFRNNVEYEVPDSFGLFSGDANQQVWAVFVDFRNQYTLFNSDLKSKLELVGSDGVSSPKGQVAECFFGEITESLLTSESRIIKYQWLSKDWVYYLFLVIPGIIISALGLYMFSGYINGLGLLVVLVVAILPSVLIGDYAWQYLANNTFRKSFETSDT